MHPTKTLRPSTTLKRCRGAEKTLRSQQVFGTTTDWTRFFFEMDNKLELSQNLKSARWKIQLHEMDPWNVKKRLVWKGTFWSLQESLHSLFWKHLAGAHPVPTPWDQSAIGFGCLLRLGFSRLLFLPLVCPALFSKLGLTIFSTGPFSECFLDHLIVFETSKGMTVFLQCSHASAVQMLKLSNRLFWVLRAIMMAAELHFTSVSYGLHWWCQLDC